MKFNPLWPLYFIVTSINFSLDTILDERFREERRRTHESESPAGKSEQTGSELIAREDDQNNSNNSDDNGTHKQSFLDDVKWLLEYNSIGPMILMINTTHITMLIYFLIKATCYSWLSHERDADSHEFTQPVLRFLESHYLVDYMQIFAEKSSQYNKMSSIMLIHYLVNRVRSLYNRFATAKYNRHCYRKLTTVETSIGYIVHLEATLVGWLKVIREGWIHKCQMGQVWRTKEMSTRLDRMDRIDRLYYYNLIDYDECFGGLEVLRDCEKDCTKSASHIEMNNNNYDNNKRKRKCRQWLRWLFTLEQPTRHQFVAKPPHRLDPYHLLLIFYLYLFVYGGSFLIYITIVNVPWILYMAQLGLDMTNFSDTLGPATRALWQNPISILCIIEGTIVITIAFLHISDMSLVVMSPVFYYSRLKKVLNLLIMEVNFYQSHINKLHLGDGDEFGSIRRNPIDSKRTLLDIVIVDDDHGVPERVELEGNSTASAAPALIEQTQPMRQIQMRWKTPMRSRSKSFRWPLGLRTNGNLKVIDEMLPQDDLWRSRSGSPNGNGNKVATMMALEWTTGSMKHSADSGIWEHNENIRYLMSLIGIMTDELCDLRRDFTFSIDLTIVFGTLCSAYGFSLMASARTMNELLFLAAAVITNLGPVLCDLFLGATVEGGLRKICRSLQSLMVNESNLISNINLKRIQNVYSYLAVRENRSFMLLGNFPLTFGSLTQILGWIATVNLVLQRFIS